MKLSNIRIVCSFCLCIWLLSSPPCFASEARSLRVVSLKPNITDTLIALGLSEKIVGITKYCPKPDSKEPPKIVGDYTQPYIEPIIALKPDIILASQENSSRASVETLQNVGFRVELFDFSNISQTKSSIERIANLLGVPQSGERVVKEMDKKLSGVKKGWANLPKKKTLVVWGTRPIIASGSGSYMDEMLDIIGAANVIKGTKIKYPKITLEEIIGFDPEIILDLSMGSESADAGTRPWEEISTISAVRNKKVITLDASMFRAGPNLPASLEKLGLMMHKESDTF